MKRLHASCAAALVAACALSASERSWAQFFPLPKPTAPVPVAPSPGSMVRGAPNGATSTMFRWKQYGIFSTINAPLPTHFVVCVKLASDNLPCVWPGTWNLPATGGVQFYENLRVVGYQYTSQPQPPGIADTFLDTPIKWIVGACVGQSNTRCSYSAAQALRLSTKDLRAVDVQGGEINHFQFQVTAQADNNGTTPSGITTTGFVLWQAYNDGPGRCLVNVNAANVGPFDEVITSDGSNIRVNTLQVNGAGQRVAPAGTIAIHPTWGFVETDDLGSQSVLPLPVNGPGNYHNLATLTLAPPGGPVFPASIAVRIHVDSTGVLAELNEGDNWKAECITIN